MKRRKPPPEPGRRDPAVARWWAGLVGLAVGCVLLDLFLIGMPLLGLSLFGPLAVGLAAQAAWRWIGRRRTDALRSVLRALMLVACAAFSFFVCQAQVATGREGAQAVADGLTAFRVRHGRYPASLQELVPAQLAALPSTGFRFGSHAFDYHLGPDGDPILAWTFHALGGRARYDFASGLVRFGD